MFYYNSLQYLCSSVFLYLIAPLFFKSFMMIIRYNTVRYYAVECEMIGIEICINCDRVNNLIFQKNRPSIRHIWYPFVSRNLSSPMWAKKTRNRRAFPIQFIPKDAWCKVSCLKKFIFVETLFFPPLIKITHVNTLETPIAHACFAYEVSATITWPLVEWQLPYFKCSKRISEY